MKTYCAGAILLSMTTLAVAQPGGTPIRVGTPAPFRPVVSLQRPQPLPLTPFPSPPGGEREGVRGIDPALQQAAFIPRIQQPQPIFRGKAEIPPTLPNDSMGILPVTSDEPPVTAAPPAELLPNMPKKLHNSIKAGDAPVPPQTSEPPATDLKMPYADGKTPATSVNAGQGEIVAAPIQNRIVIPGQPVAIGDCGDCNPCYSGACCMPNCCPSCCGCCCYPRSRAWLSAEYLQMMFSHQRVPPLLTTSAVQAEEGRLGEDTTSILYDDEQLNANDWHNGARIAGGFWFKNIPCWGLDASAFIIFRETDNFFRASNGDPLLARPFLNNLNGEQDSILVASEAEEITGSINISNFSKLWGYDVNLRRKFTCGCTYHSDVLLGYRQIQLSEGIDIVDLENFTAVGDQFQGNVFESFHTRNTFYGGQIGVDGEYRFAPRWSLAGTLKVALGSVHQTVSINGLTLFIDDTNVNPPEVVQGGVLALASNIGTHRRNRFAVAPEAQIKLQYRLNDRWRVFAGYNVLVISSVLRPGEQIDPVLDANQIPINSNPPMAGTRPAVLFKSSAFVAHGFSGGLQCDF